MWNDPIVKEIRAVREAYTARFNYGIHAIMRDMRQRQETEGRQTVSFEKKRTQEAGAAAPAES